MCSRHLHAFCQVFFKEGQGGFIAFLIVYVIAGQLDDPDAQITGKSNGFFHDLQASLTDMGIMASKGIFAVPTQTHGLKRHFCLIHQVDQLFALMMRPVQP